MDYQSPKLKNGQHLRRFSQVTINTAMNDFNSGQFKVRMKKMTAQFNFVLYPNLFLPESWHIFAKKRHYLLKKTQHMCPLRTYINCLLKYSYLLMHKRMRRFVKIRILVNQRLVSDCVQAKIKWIRATHTRIAYARVFV